jgi:predicted transcriptional regulator
VRNATDRQQIRDQLLKDALSVWSDYQAAGLHLTEEEADAWLTKLEAGTNEKAPKPHI